MRMFETLFIKMSDGTSRWLSEDQTKQSSLSGELRIVAKADEGNAFMLDGEILGEQIWLRESIDASNL